MLAIAREAEEDPDLREGRAAHRPAPPPRRGDGGAQAGAALAG